MPGPAGVPLRQPVEVRPVIGDEGLGADMSLLAVAGLLLQPHLVILWSVAA